MKSYKFKYKDNNNEIRETIISASNGKHAYYLIVNDDKCRCIVGRIRELRRAELERILKLRQTIGEIA